jgi:hypothetical protein
MKRVWFKDRDWEYVVSVNAGLCQSGSALHKPTSDGYQETKAFWIENCDRELTLAEAVEICRRCHRMAPFCFYNGNTFVAIIRDCLSHAPGFDAVQITLAKSLTGHMVAGTAEPEEIEQFKNLLHDIEHGTGECRETPPFQVGDRVQTLKRTLTGTVEQIEAGGNITWKCDQTGVKMIGTPRTLKARPAP